MDKKEFIEEMQRTVVGYEYTEEGISNVLFNKKGLEDLIDELDEPDKPVVPNFVAEWYEKNKFKSWWNRLYKWGKEPIEDELEKRVHDWFVDHHEYEFVDMHRIGYTVEKENFYYIKKDAGTNYLYFTSIDVYGDGKINYNSESDKFRALKLPKEKAEALAVIADGEIEEVSE